ncbi:hypothetical protein Tco_0884196 [Tanacetum coccineum]
MNDTQINFCRPSVFSQAVDELPQVEVPAQVQPSNDPACMNREIHVGMPFRSEYTDRIIDTAHTEHAHVPNPGLEEIASHVPGFPSTWGNEKLILTSARIVRTKDAHAVNASFTRTISNMRETSSSREERKTHPSCVEASRSLPMQSAPSILVDTQVVRRQSAHSISVDTEGLPELDASSSTSLNVST